MQEVQGIQQWFGLGDKDGFALVVNGFRMNLDELDGGQIVHPVTKNADDDVASAVESTKDGNHLLGRSLFDLPLRHTFLVRCVGSLLPFACVLHFSNPPSPPAAMRPRLKPCELLPRFSRPDMDSRPVTMKGRLRNFKETLELWKNFEWQSGPGG